MSKGPIDSNELLDSWKEIASYLGRDIRTVARWEKELGLPVRRIQSKTKSRIIAYKCELDRWRIETFRCSQGNEKHIKRPSLRLMVCITLPIALVLSLIMLLRKNADDVRPYDFKTDKTGIILLNKSGKEIGRFDTDITNLLEESDYRERYQQRRVQKETGHYFLPLLMCKDINMDGKIEVLYSPQTKDGKGTDRLYCIGQDCVPIWQIRAGRSVAFGGRSFPSDFVLQGFDVCDLDNDGKDEVVCVANAVNEWPCRLMVISADGKVLEEYWNSGQLLDLAFADLNRDGKKEILAAGLNNEYARGCLIIFNSSNIAGASPQSNSDFRSPQIIRGTEKRYILFPRTDVDLLKWPMECVRDIELLGQNLIRVRAALSGIYYDFDYRLSLSNVELSHGFVQEHNVLSRERKIRSTLDDAYRRRIRNGVVYYAGTKWELCPSTIGNY